MPSPIEIKSEIGPLKRVLVHRPGREIVRMTQHDLDRMLFDDILAPDETAAEHDLLTEVMTEAGAEVLQFGSLLESAMTTASLDDRYRLIQTVCEQQGALEIAERLMDWTPHDLASSLIEGIYWDQVQSGLPASLARLGEPPGEHRRFALSPLPNLMFMRDPCIAVYDRIVRGRMATGARAREPWLVAFALQHSPQTQVSLCFEANDVARSPCYRSLEGGDVLVLSPQAVMIGCSIRTTAQTIQRLAEEALFELHPQLERVYVVMMPESRSVMHLDTILTHIDRELFLGHLPLLQGDHARPGLAVARLQRNAPPTRLSASILDILRQEFGTDIQLIPCGGHNPLHQEREQWTDGANAVALGPGHIILYARNTHTIRTLREHGFEEVRLSVVQPVAQRRELIATGLQQSRTVFSFSGSELSRARGGGRCLTMPLNRTPFI